MEKLVINIFFSGNDLAPGKNKYCDLYATLSNAQEYIIDNISPKSFHNF